MEFRFNYKDEKFEIDVKKCGFFASLKGLMFCRRSQATALLFDDMKGGIHSFFVFFDFLAVWLNSYGEILRVERVKPWTAFVENKGKKLVEIPVNERYKKIVGRLLKASV